MEEQQQGQWLNLTNDVLALILKRLQTKADLCRFRSICKQWRSFASPLKPHLLFPLSLPPIDPNFRPFSISPTLLYLLSPPNSNHVWLVKVSETGDNRWALLNPLTNNKLSFPSGVFHPRMINLLGFNNSEVGRSYRLQSVGDLGENSFDLGDYTSSINVKKVAVKITLDELVVVVLNGFSGNWEMRSRFGQIWVWKLGDEKWNVVEKENYFDDVICYDGEFYAVDRRGRLAVIDTTSFKVAEVVAPKEDCKGHYAYLVESNFGLYLVNIVVTALFENYYDEDEKKWVIRNSVDKPIAFKVFVFNNGREKGWEKVESLGDKVFFVTPDAAFSVRAEDLGWSKGNCIYFEGLTAYDDELDMALGVNGGVYSLDDQFISTFGSLAHPRTKNFWPPLSWFVRVEDYLEY